MAIVWRLCVCRLFPHQPVLPANASVYEERQQSPCQQALNQEAVSQGAPSTKAVLLHLLLPSQGSRAWPPAAYGSAYAVPHAYKQAQSVTCDPASQAAGGWAGSPSGAGNSSRAMQRLKDMYARNSPSHECDRAPQPQGVKQLLQVSVVLLRVLLQMLYAS